MTMSLFVRRRDDSIPENCGQIIKDRLTVYHNFPADRFNLSPKSARRGLAMLDDTTKMAALPL